MNIDLRYYAMDELHVTPEEFRDFKDWSLLPVGEFASRVFNRYPRLRELPFRAEVKVIVDFRHSSSNMAKFSTGILSPLLPQPSRLNRGGHNNVCNFARHIYFVIAFVLFFQGRSC